MPELYSHYSASAETKYMKKRSKWLKDVEHFIIAFKLNEAAQIETMPSLLSFYTHVHQLQDES
jgi:hypothetical protein